MLNAPIKEPISIHELRAWLSGEVPVTAGKGTYAVYAFFVEVPKRMQVEFLNLHSVQRSDALRIADRYARPKVVGEHLPIDEIP